MSRVRYCSQTNSTLFTTCCGTAISDDETKCPHCKKEVPYTPRERHDMAMKALYGVSNVRKWRAELENKIKKEQENGK